MKKKLAMLLTAAAIGCAMTPALSTEAAWNVDGAGWWYTHPDGSYTTNSWEWVNGAWYHFDGTGYMQTGWQWIDGAWYYMDGSGAMLTGWQVIDGSWYYLNGNGSMAANQWVGNYYVDGGTVCNEGKYLIGNYDVLGGDGCWIPGYMERHSGSQTTMVGGIVTVTEDIPEMDGSRLTVSGICLTDRGICRPAGRMWAALGTICTETVLWRRISG